MALLEEWILSRPIDSDLSALLDRVLRDVLPDHLERRVELDGGVLRAIVLVSDGDLQDLAVRLDGPLDHFDGWEWRDEIDALDEGDTYEFWVEFESKQPETFDSGDRALPLLNVYSKDGDNLAAWPVAFVLAARLAAELGAREPEEESGEAS